MARRAARMAMRRARLADAVVDPVQVGGGGHQQEDEGEGRGDHGRGRDGRDHEPEPTLHDHADAASGEHCAGRQRDHREGRRTARDDPRTRNA
jgi:hypothetical protein